jgi:segregation and condensation protein B
VVELGRSNTPGRPILFGTAFEFLERFGLESLDDLTPLDSDVAARLAEEGGAMVLPLELDDPGVDARDGAAELADFATVSARAAEAESDIEPG